jgi:hypothetical protein
MSDIFSWNHRWFGLWKELGRGYESCPSVYDFVDVTVSDFYDVERLINYIESAHVIVTTSRVSFPCVITRNVFTGSLSDRTDGVWWWRDDLGYYIRNHHVCIPVKMLSNIVQNNYTPPFVTETQINTLESFCE